MSELEGKKLDLSQDLSDLEFLRLTKFQGFIYKLIHFFKGIPNGIKKLFIALGKLIGRALTAVKNEFTDIFTTFVNGDFKTKLSYLVMGFGSIARGQILRGILFLLFEVVFIVYEIKRHVFMLKFKQSRILASPGKIYICVSEVCHLFPEVFSYLCVKRHYDSYVHV